MTKKTIDFEQTKLEGECAEYNGYDTSTVTRAIRNVFPDGRDEFVIDLDQDGDPWVLHMRKHGDEYVGLLCLAKQVTGYPVTMRLWRSTWKEEEWLLLGTWKNTDEPGEVNEWSIRLWPEESEGA